MGRILFFVLLAVAAWIGWRLWKDKQRLQAKRDAAAARSAVEGEALVQCRHCGVRLPRSTAVTVGDSYFCTAEHRDAHGSGP